MGGRQKALRRSRGCPFDCELRNLTKQWMPATSLAEPGLEKMPAPLCLGTYPFKP